MAQDYTTTALIAQVKNLTHEPTSSKSFTNDDFLAHADFVLQGELVPLIRSVREDYLVKLKKYASASTVYLPPRAIGMSISNVQLVVNNNVNRIPIVSTYDIDTYIGSPTDTFVCYFTGNILNILPTPTVGEIWLYYFMRPGSLVLPSACAQITGIASNVLTCSSVPSTMLVGVTTDIVSQIPGFETYQMDTAITAVTSNTITFADAVPSTVSIGDYVCIAGESPVPQLPVELHPLLAQMIAVKVCEANGYEAKFNQAMAKLAQMKETAMKLITPRNEQGPRFIQPDDSLIPRRRRRWIY